MMENHILGNSGEADKMSLKVTEGSNNQVGKWQSWGMTTHPTPHVSVIISKNKNVRKEKNIYIFF